MSPLLIVIVIVAAVAAGAFFFVGRKRSLPAAPERAPLPGAEPKPEAKPGAQPEAKAEPAAPEAETDEATPDGAAASGADAAQPDDGAGDAAPETPPAERPTVRKTFSFIPPPVPGAQPGDTKREDAKPPGKIPPLPGAPVPKKTPAPAPAPAKPPVAEPAPEPVPLPRDKPTTSKFDAQAEARERLRQDRERVREGLAKTRGGFVSKLAKLFRGKPKVDDDLKDEVEEVLFTADIGTATAQKLLDRVTEVLDRSDVADPAAVWSVVRSAARDIVGVDGGPADTSPDKGPYVLLMIGVNGVGKTTTLGKLAARHAEAGRKVLLVAGDTFRAAAVEQLDVWARRVGCDIHRGQENADPSSVIFDGITRGRKEGYDVVLCDTAGRLHTRKELMDELAKVGRATTKAIAAGLPESERAGVEGPHDTFLVLDATIGQNALAQAQLFKETMDFTGLVLTKLDGTAKGGVLLGICDELRIPVRYIGIGEGVEDLRDFDADVFVDALFEGADDGETA